MVEAERFARLLAKRIQAAGLSVLQLEMDSDHNYFVVTLETDIKQNVMLCVWVHSNGSIRDVLSFVNEGSISGRFLNYWRRPEGVFEIPQLVDQMWSAFWAHEEENQARHRILWMPAKQLPECSESHSEGPVLFPVPTQKKKPTVKTTEERATLLELFKA